MSANGAPCALALSGRPGRLPPVVGEAIDHPTLLVRRASLFDKPRRKEVVQDSTRRLNEAAKTLRGLHGQRPSLRRDQ